MFRFKSLQFLVGSDDWMSAGGVLALPPAVHRTDTVHHSTNPQQRFGGRERETCHEAVSNFKHPTHEWCRSSQRPTVEKPSELNTKYPKKKRNYITTYNCKIHISDWKKKPWTQSRTCLLQTTELFLLFCSLNRPFFSPGTSAFSHLNSLRSKIKSKVVTINNKIKLLIKYKTAIWVLSPLTQKKKSFSCQFQNTTIYSLQTSHEWKMNLACVYTRYLLVTQSLTDHKLRGVDGGLLRSLGVLDGACAEVSHFGIFHLLLVQLVLRPQQQLQQFSQFGGRLPVFIVQNSLVHLTPHLCTQTRGQM